MDAYNDAFECESELLSMLSEAEELSVKKARIYSRLLTDAALAEDMEALALRHETAQGRARQACGGKEMKNSKREITLNEYDSLEGHALYGKIADAGILHRHFFRQEKGDEGLSRRGVFLRGGGRVFPRGFACRSRGPKGKRLKKRCTFSSRCDIMVPAKNGRGKL